MPESGERDTMKTDLFVLEARQSHYEHYIDLSGRLTSSPLRNTGWKER